MAGCPLLVPSGELPAVPYHTLPSSVDDLVQLADRVHRTTRKTDDLVRARTAMIKANRLNKGSYGSQWRLARVASVLAMHDDKRGEAWAAEGRTAGLQAVKLKDHGVEGHLYLSMTTGFLIKHKPSKAEDLTTEVIAHAKRANALDKTFEGGEPRRILGAIYTYAPAWPSGVGDLDEAIEVLESVANDLPQEPLNLYYLAEAYRRAEEIEKAVRLYRRVRAFKPRGLWRLEGRRYRKQARDYIQLLTKN